MSKDGLRLSVIPSTSNSKIRTFSSPLSKTANVFIYNSVSLQPHKLLTILKQAALLKTRNFEKSTDRIRY